MQQCVTDVADASDVELATYMYDNEMPHDALMKRLQRRSPFTLNVRIDRETLAGRKLYYQRSRLLALRDKGATIWVCKGEGRNGAYHRKALIVNRRYMYTGGANFTQKSKRNKELCSARLVLRSTTL